MSRLLGGVASPIGWSVQYIHASLDAYGHGVVVQQLVHWPRRTVSLAEATRELNR